jgi:D-glycero-alpha-D-manno-heptose-7-phosphate kinase
MIITQTPLRVSFLGGNTDFPSYFKNSHGLVLTSTIDKYIYCIVKKRFDKQIIVNYTIKETVNNVKKLKHDLVREALKLLKIENGIEISFLSDIPSEGTGLGSSSAVLVGLLNALHTYLGDNVGAMQLADEACHIELGILKKSIGIQDQYAVANGGIRGIFFFPNEVHLARVNIEDSVKEDLNNSLMLLYTGITRKTDEVLGSFKPQDNIELLNRTKMLAKTGIEALVKGNLRLFGITLNEYWEIKKTMNNKVSNGIIDEMYKKALNAGAFGGKVLGAGGGGFLLVMFPANKRAKVKEALKDYKELPFRFENSGSRVIFNIQ